MNDKALHQLSYGLFVLTARQDEKDNGCIINTAGQVTALPTRISITVSKENLTHDMILSTGIFSLSILSEKADFSIFRRFGFQSGRDTDKFSGYSHIGRSENGLLYLTEGTNAYITGRVEKTVDLGTHTLFIGPAEDMDLLDSSPSVTYAYYHEKIKPRPDTAKAPGETIWRCRICGYEYVGEELPPDFICPLCKHPASDFEKISGA